MAINFTPQIASDSLRFGPGNIVQNGLILNLDAANPRSYLPPYDGLTWYDLTGNNDVSLINGALYNSSKYGGILLDGVNDYISGSFSNPFAETVIVWASSASSNFWTQYGWISSARFQNGHLISPTNGIKDVIYYVSDSSSVLTYIGAVVPDSIITPHMYSYTTNGSNKHRGYFDGDLACESTTSIVRTNTPSAQNWWLGRDTYDLYYLWSNRFGYGTIYSVMRYNRELSSEEILQNYRATKSRYL